MTLNLIAFMKHWDVYPFILLNLLFSTQAACSSDYHVSKQTNRRDRAQRKQNYQTNLDAKLEIEALTSKTE
jgi:uncharacterized membrane protein